MLNRLPRSIGARHLHTIVLVLIAGSLMSFALGQQMAHGARSGGAALGERVPAVVMSAPHETARTANHPTSVAVVSRAAPKPAKHHDGDHQGDGDHGGGGGDGGGGDHGGGGGD